jgi:hypothetical protein
MRNYASIIVCATQDVAIDSLAVSTLKEDERGTGDYWQGIVAENMGYATVLYLDAAIVVAALALIPFLKNRDEHAEDRGQIGEQAAT